MRVKGGFTKRRHHKRLLKLAEGFRGRRGNCFKHSKIGVQKALAYAYRDRRVRKREFRQLWIARINASVRPLGLTYSRFICGLKRSGVELDRKALADLALKDPALLKQVAERAAAAL